MPDYPKPHANRATDSWLPARRQVLGWSLTLLGLGLVAILTRSVWWPVWLPQAVIELSDPVTVALAPAEIKEWGPYQFPGLERREDGAIGIRFHVESDSAQAYGLPPGRAVSTDEGRTWQVLPRESAANGTASSWQSPPIELPNGDLIWACQQRPFEAKLLPLPEKPFGTFVSYGKRFDLYRTADLPEECLDGWQIYRRAAGVGEPTLERAEVRIPGETRYVAEGVLRRPWFQTLLLAPDGAVWAVQYETRLVDDVLRPHWWAMILRSTDGGRTFDLWSEIPYTPDVAADAHADVRNGFTEPNVCFMSDGSVICLMRTTDGSGPGPLYISRSTDNGRTWSRPAVFDNLGVWPQILRLRNGVTLAAYGRPGLYLRATTDPAGLRWAPRITVVPPGDLHTETCSYASLLPLGDDRALLAYSDFNLRHADGQRCKGIRVREVRVTNPAAPSFPMETVP
jgi:hypothetical protein